LLENNRILYTDNGWPWQCQNSSSLMVGNSGDTFALEAAADCSNGLADTKFLGCTKTSPIIY
jgi:hypothetical protein